MQIFVLIFLLFVSYGCSDIARPTESASPNIIFILTDDQRWDALGYAGNQLAHTPELDQLASQGLYFSHAMATTPICAASRATILTGMYERSHRYDFQNIEIRSEFMESSYPRELRKAGYYTGFFGKFGVKYPDADSLFDEFESYDRNNKFKDYRGYYYKTLEGDTVHLTRYTGQKALDFIGQAPQDKPFCLSLSFSAPHAHDGAPEQYFWQEESDDILANTTVPGPDLGEDTWFDRLPEKVKEGFNRLRWYWRYDTPEKYQHSIKGYHRMIAGIDREIGAIREKLKAEGLDENTVIIVMGDNGFILGERQLAGKWLMYDNSVRVPLIIYDPRHPHHQDIDQMAMNVDIPSTILDLAGGEIPSSWQGRSLVPFLTSESYDLGRDTALIEHLWEFENIPPSEGLRTGQWKYFRYVNDQSIEELYNLENDPAETINLAGQSQYRQTVEGFRRHLDQLAYEYRDPYVGCPTELQVVRNSGSGLQQYSWKIPEGAGSQISYQILVASGRDIIDLNKGDVWNSGEVKTPEFTNITQPDRLEPGQKYFWKVRIWDNLNRLSDYSPVNEFTIP